MDDSSRRLLLYAHINTAENLGVPLMVTALQKTPTGGKTRKSRYQQTKMPRKPSLLRVVYVPGIRITHTCTAGEAIKNPAAGWQVARRLMHSAVI